MKDSISGRYVLVIAKPNKHSMLPLIVSVGILLRMSAVSGTSIDAEVAEINTSSLPWKVISTSHLCSHYIRRKLQSLSRDQLFTSMGLFAEDAPGIIVKRFNEDRYDRLPTSVCLLTWHTKRSMLSLES